MKNLCKNFFRCGILGWCLEIIFTALQSLRKRQPSLMGTTSLWMFPIYGLGCLFGPLYRFLSRFPTWLRGLFYTGGIFGVEYLTGRALDKRQMCPWDYHNSHWQIRNVIRLDYAPCWFITGLLMERLSARRISTK